MLISIPEDFPIMAGQALRVNAGLEIRLDQSRKPPVSPKGVSLMGVPMPNACLGNIKNVDLVNEYDDQDFWKNFAEGVNDIQIRQGEVFIKLLE